MASLKEARAFIRTLKRNFPNFESLAEALIDFREGNTDSAALVSRVSALLHGHRDLMAGFNKFLPEKYKLPIPSADADIPTQSRLSLKRSRKVLKEAVEFVNKVRKSSEDDDVYTSFLRVVTDFQAHRNIARVDKEISALFKAKPELYIDFTWFVADSWPDNGRNRDLGVSFTKTAAKKAPKSDKTLEACEDELYESDMLFHFLESTKKATEKLLKETGEKGNGDHRINVEDYYSAMNLRCIEHMYEKYEGDVMEVLRSNPTAASSVLLHRLNEKLEEAGKLREKVKERCAERIRNCYRETERRKEDNQVITQH